MSEIPAIAEKTIPNRLERFLITRELTPAQKVALVINSTTIPQIRAQTSDLSRFRTDAAVADWVASGSRAIYPLVAATERSKTLAGIAWFNKKEMPADTESLASLDLASYQYSFAIRVYPNYQRLKLAPWLMEESYKDFTSSPDYQQNASGFWVKTGMDNFRARQIFEEFGFRVVGVQERRVVMILPRVISLPHAA
jgi:GNAT superfamily N-acetyltransferase